MHRLYIFVCKIMAILYSSGRFLCCRTITARPSPIRLRGHRPEVIPLPIVRYSISTRSNQLLADLYIVRVSPETAAQSNIGDSFIYIIHIRMCAQANDVRSASKANGLFISQRDETRICADGRRVSATNCRNSPPSPFRLEFALEAVHTIGKPFRACTYVNMCHIM